MLPRTYTAPGMQHTIDIENSNLDTGFNCDKWGSKARYSALAMGGQTLFELLYLDYSFKPEFAIRAVDSFMEGGVRPPS